MTPVSQSSPPSCCHTVAANCHFSVRSTQWFQNQLFNWFLHWAHQESHSTSHPSTLHSSTSLSWAVLCSCVSTPLVGYFCMAHGVTTSCEMMLQQWGSSHQRLLSYLFNCSCYAQIKKKNLQAFLSVIFSWLKNNCLVQTTKDRGLQYWFAKVSHCMSCLIYLRLVETVF